MTMQSLVIPLREQIVAARKDGQQGPRGRPVVQRFQTECRAVLEQVPADRIGKTKTKKGGDRHSRLEAHADTLRAGGLRSKLISIDRKGHYQTQDPSAQACCREFDALADAIAITFPGFSPAESRNLLRHANDATH